MNWAQENKKLAGIVGVMVAGAGGLGAWLFFSWSGYAASMERWQSTQARIATIKGKKLEPTQANVEAREKLLLEYSDKVNSLRTALLSVQQAVKPMSETEFQAKLKERATEVKRLSKAAGMKPELADDFALGFDRYAAQSPRSAEIAAELNIHLDVIEELVKTCIEAGVTSIDALERTKLANEDAPAAPKVSAAPAKKTAKATTKSSKAKKTVITEQAAAEPVLDRYPIKLTFTSDQGPLQAVMNTLSDPRKMTSHFLVVRQFRVENSRLDGPTKEEMNQRRAATPVVSGDAASALPPAEAPKADAPKLILPPKAGPEDAFDIMGNEQLKVYMEVDYIRFRAAPELEEEEAAAPAPAKP